jgi:hypothetical protein
LRTLGRGGEVLCNNSMWPYVGAVVVVEVRVRLGLGGVTKMALG